MGRLAEHGNGIALIFARTETETWFRHIWGRSSAVLFLQGRLSFYNVDGTKGKNGAGGPSALVAYGQENAVALRNARLAGAFMAGAVVVGVTQNRRAMRRRTNNAPTSRETHNRRSHQRLVSRSWLVLRDGWLPDRQFDLGQEAERDAYIAHCRASYQDSYSYVLQHGDKYVRGVMRAAGFGTANSVLNEKESG